MSNNKQQTAVDFLVEKMLTQDWYTYKSLEYIKQAKEMHKQEIINSFFEGAYGGDNISGEQYYNETYGGGEQ